MGYDVAAVRAQFPALGAGIAHFDGPGGSQTPRAVADAIHATLLAGLSNRGRSTPPERRADATVTAARAAVADLLGADPRGVVFARSMTQATYDLSRTLAKDWRAGDEVVVSRLDHDANVRPWVQAAEAAGAAVRWADFDPGTGELTPEHVAAVLGPRTRLVALTGASNLIGTMPPLAQIGRLVHAAGALFAVDGVHLTAHAAVDLAGTGADFYTCSPYKFLGPHCGVLAADPALLETLRPDKLLPSTDEVPERFELGTLPYEVMAGVTAAVDVLAGLGDPPPAAGTAPGTPAAGTPATGIAPATGTPDGPAAPAPGPDRRRRVLAGMSALAAHEDALRERLEEGLAQLPGVTVWSRAARRTPTLLLTFAGRRAADASAFLAARDVAAPSGSFYALEPARRLGLGDAGGLRVGIAPYTSVDDIDRLLRGLELSVTR
jgi:cysteine desulfurase family protein (TIGR01976 family)